jgi:hypothetical protein
MAKNKSAKKKTSKKTPAKKAAAKKKAAKKKGPQKTALVHLNERDADYGTRMLLITRRQDDGRFQVEQWINGAMIEVVSNIETAEHYDEAMSDVSGGCYSADDFHDQIKRFDKSLGLLLEQWREEN